MRSCETPYNGRLGRNFITDPSVKGKVTVYSPIKISAQRSL